MNLLDEIGESDVGRVPRHSRCERRRLQKVSDGDTRRFTGRMRSKVILQLSREESFAGTLYSIYLER